MTDLLTRPVTRTTVHSDRGRPLPLVVLASVAWAVGVGLAVVTVVVLLAWSTDAASTAGASTALHAAGHAWLLAHAVPLELSGGRLALVPLGVTLLPAALLWRAGGTVARSTEVADLRAAARVTAGLAGAYGVMAAVVALVAATPDVRAAPLRALAGAAALAAVMAGGGVLRHSGLGTELAGRVPTWPRALLPAVAAGLLVLAATGALLAGVSLGWHAGTSAEVSRALAEGPVGAAGLLLIGLLLLPNAVVWAACYAVGPGFAVGAGTAVTPFGVTLGPVPALPLLAALPGDGSAAHVSLLALLGPVAAGVMIGAVALRRQPSAGRRVVALGAAASGAAAGLVLGLAAWGAGGPLGPGRLAVAGPSPWRVALAAGCELAAVAAGVAWWRWGRRRVSG